MFKLGYQAFMMMSIASVYVMYRLHVFASEINPWVSRLFPFSILFVYVIIFHFPVAPDKVNTFTGPSWEYLLIVPVILLIFLIIKYVNNGRAVIALCCMFVMAHILTLVAVYPLFGFPSYYGNLQKTSQQRQQENIKTDLNGIKWLGDLYPEDLEIVNYINNNIDGQPVILEAQGDSYTDYERISANTGLPTVAGWWVHEWLWRNSSDVVGKRIPDIENIYQSQDINLTKQLLQKYHVKYVVVSDLERKKYPALDEEKFSIIGKKIFQSKNGLGALYQINQ